MDDYIELLIFQFKSAVKVKNLDVNSAEFMKEFKEWLCIRNECGQDYLDLLDEMEFPYNNSHCAEVGKGKHDSLVLNNMSTKLITPYCEGITSDRVIEGTLIMKKGKPFYKKQPKVVLGLEGQIDTFMTQNPYNSMAIKGWEQLHNNGNNIIIGVYGASNDKNMETRIKRLSLLKSNLIGNFVFESFLNYESYGAVLATKKTR